MKSTKCPQCGLVYWATDPQCKRCGMATADPSLAQPYAAAQQQQQPWCERPQPMQVMNFAEDPAKAKLIKNLKGDSIYFYVIGGLQILLWLVVGQLMIVDGILNIGLSFVVYKFKSRIAAICLLGLTFLAAMSTVLAIAAGMRGGLFFPIGLIIRLLVS